MSLIHANFFSEQLARAVDVNIILPDTHLNNDEKYRVLYLLHGLSGDYSNWIRYTNIELYAKEHNLAVVMPSGYNSFYHDNYYDFNYEVYIIEDVIGYIEKTFPISENRMIGGLSMGGYGAMYLGLKYSKYFTNIIALSGCLEIRDLQQRLTEGKLEHINFNKKIFNAENKEGTTSDIKYLIDKCKTIPEIYIACGTEDYLYESNVAIKNYLEIENISFIYEEGPGEHNWLFWDKYIKKALESIANKN